MLHSDLATVETGTARTSHGGAAHRIVIFAVVSVALFVVAVDQTIVATALPSIQHELHTEVNWSGWTITIFNLGQVLAMPVAGKLSDQFGRKTIFFSAVAVFTLASLCCALTNSIAMLIALRGVQSLGGGAFMPSASGIVADTFGENRDRALAMFTSILPIGGIVGPVLGGFFVTYWSWRGIFLVNVPIGLMLLVLGPLVVPRTGRRSRTPVDPGGMTLLGITILAVMFGFANLGAGSVSALSWEFLVPEGAGVVAGVLFLLHIRRHATPFIPIRLLYGRGFGVMNVINLVYGGVVLGLAAMIPLYAEQRYDLKPLSAGTLLTARAVGMIAVAGLAAMALRRTGARRPMTIGFVFIAGGLVLVAMAPVGLGPYAWLAMGTAIAGLGMGMAVPATNNATLQLAPEQVAAITGLRGMFRQSGAILSLSVSTALLARSSHPAMLQSHFFLVFALLVAALIPLNFLVPEYRGGW